MLHASPIHIPDAGLRHATSHMLAGQSLNTAHEAACLSVTTAFRIKCNIATMLHAPGHARKLILGTTTEQHYMTYFILKQGGHQGDGSEAADAGHDLRGAQEEGQQQPGALQRVRVQLGRRPHCQQRHALQPED